MLEWIFCVGMCTIRWEEKTIFEGGFCSPADIFYIRIVLTKKVRLGFFVILICHPHNLPKNGQLQWKSVRRIWGWIWMAQKSRIIIEYH